MKSYKTKTGVIQYKQNLQKLLKHCKDDDDSGYCLACGEEAYGVDPDARKATCESCKAPKVYGCQELILMSLYHS